MTACRRDSLPRSLSPKSRKLAEDVNRILTRHRSYSNLQQFLFPSSDHQSAATKPRELTAYTVELDGVCKGRGLMEPESPLARSPSDGTTHSPRRSSGKITSPGTGRSSIINSPVSHVAMWGRKSKSRASRIGVEKNRLADESQQVGRSELQPSSEHLSDLRAEASRRRDAEALEGSLMAKAELESLRRERAELQRLRMANRELLVANDYLLQEHGRIVQDLRKRLTETQSELDKWNLAYTSLPHRFMPADSEDRGG
ncbi:hypothetical protein FOL46_009022 [Perkinsus olseni]|uniref:Uncharacterized protein n=2 Tax=Perkinsus olseni TaxID=32597 RepID=A0A7J6MLE6_PEROL|nr:hypothetical protein FOL46_009022 [Perkinsus olseni]